MVTAVTSHVRPRLLYRRGYAAPPVPGRSTSFVLEWLDRFLSNLWWLGIGKLELVYRVDFVIGKVAKNDIAAPPLWVSATLNPSQNPVPTPGPLSLSTGGLLLSITKAGTDTRAAVMVALSPKPASLRRFRMVANCSLPGDSSHRRTATSGRQRSSHAMATRPRSRIRWSPARHIRCAAPFPRPRLVHRSRLVWRGEPRAPDLKWSTVVWSIPTACPRTFSCRRIWIATVARGGRDCTRPTTS